MGDDLLKASVRPEPVPAGLGDPQTVLALVCEVPGALVQAPQAGGVGGCGLIDHEEATIRKAAMDVGQRLCGEAYAVQTCGRPLDTKIIGAHSQEIGKPQCQTALACDGTEGREPRVAQGYRTTSSPAMLSQVWTALEARMRLKGPPSDSGAALFTSHVCMSNMLCHISRNCHCLYAGAHVPAQ